MIYSCNSGLNFLQDPWNCGGEDFALIVFIGINAKIDFFKRQMLQTLVFLSCTFLSYAILFEHME